MRPFRLAALVVATALLSAPLTAQATRRYVVSIDGHSRPIALDTMGVRIDLAGVTTAEAWQALLAVYDEAKIATTVRDSSAGSVGNLSLVQRRTLWKKPLSRFFDCGAAVTGPNADSYKITLALLSWVVPSAKGATIWTAVVAGGRDISGSSNHSTTCQSLGQLEGTIHDAVKGRLQVRVSG